MSKSLKTFTAFFLIGLAALLITAQVLAQNETPPTTIAEAITRAEKDQVAAQLIVTELTQALAAARTAGDTDAVQTLNSALRQAEVRVAQVVQQVDQVKRAPTLAAAVAQLQNADRALARVTDVIQALPPVVTQKYVTTVATTTVATTAATTTTETTTETTAGTTVAPTTTETTTGTTAATTTTDTTAATTAATTVATTIATTTTVFTTTTFQTTSTVLSR